MKIIVDTKVVYLLEAERRCNDDGGYMEDLPILMLWSPGFLPIDRTKFELLLTMTVINPSNTWPKDTSSLKLRRHGIEHRSESKFLKNDTEISEVDREKRILSEAVTRLGKAVTWAIKQ